MARCVCNNPCTCYFEYDGDRPNGSYTLPYQYGRYSTRRTGTGTAADPYIIEFLDSEEFYVEAGEVRTTSDNVISSSGFYNVAVGFGNLPYETPTEMFLGVVIHGPNGFLYANAHKFWLVSAQATFVYGGSTSGTRGIVVTWNPPAPSYGPLSTVPVAGFSTTASMAEDITVSCSGLAPFSAVVKDINVYGPGGYFQVKVQQSSGSSMTVRDIRFSMVAI